MNCIFENSIYNFCIKPHKTLKEVQWFDKYFSLSFIMTINLITLILAHVTLKSHEKYNYVQLP